MNLINFKKAGIVLGIIIVLNLFVNFGVATFYNAPKYDDFCLAERRAVSYDSKERCEKTGGLWTENQNFKDIKPAPSRTDSVISEPSGWCDIDYSCRKDFETADNLYKRNVFIILAVLGVIFLISGFFITSQSILSVAFTYGGLLSVVVGTIRFWSEMDDYLRFIMLGVALFILIWIAIKKFKN